MAVACLQRGLCYVFAPLDAPKCFVRARACALGVMACASMLASNAPAQQTFPVKPVRAVVSAAAGTGLDATIRVIAPKLSDHWKQALVIDNRQGIIANSTVAKAPPDGYTLLFVSGSIAVRHVMFNNLPYDTLKDFSGVTELYTPNSVVVVGPAMGVKTVKDLVEYAQSRPGKIFFASPVAGGMDHMNSERFRIAAGIKAQHVSYKGSGEALIEVAAGRAHFTVVSVLVAQSLIKDGKVVPIVQRHPVLQGVPLIANVLPEWTLVGASAVYAPAGTPLALRQQIGKDIARVLHSPDLKERLDSVGIHVSTTTPEEHDRKLRADIAAFAKVMKEIGLKPN
jgi:tripartite-type tricarboxylate transporter receptor subunit TctC